MTIYDPYCRKRDRRPVKEFFTIETLQTVAAFTTVRSTMKSLPTPLSTAQLEGILSQLATMPSATVNRHPDIITVTATRKATGETVKVLSAATRDGRQWHVMTIPGLVSPVTA